MFRPKSPISMMAQLNIITRQLVSICLKQIFIHVGFDITCIQKTFFLICNFHAQRTIILIIQIRTNILLHNIIKRILPVITIEAMQRDFGTRFEDCYVYLGPSIGPESFEVNQELADTFTDEWKKITDANSDELVQYIVRDGASKATPHVDLWRFIEEDLLQRGVPKDQICIGGTDSMTDENCFSYRREHGKTGRMALFGMLEKR